LEIDDFQSVQRNKNTWRNGGQVVAAQIDLRKIFELVEPGVIATSPIRALFTQSRAEENLY